MDLKNFSRMEKFSGGDSAWKDWSFDLKVLTVSINPSMHKWFGICETTQDNLTPKNLKSLYAMEKVESRGLEANH